MIHGETPLLARHVERISSDLWISLGARTVTDAGSIARGELNPLRGTEKIPFEFLFTHVRTYVKFNCTDCSQF